MVTELEKLTESLDNEVRELDAKYKNLLSQLQSKCTHANAQWIHMVREGETPSNIYQKVCFGCGMKIDYHVPTLETIAKIAILNQKINVAIEKAKKSPSVGEKRKEET